jgi:hypothetical protein
VVLSEARKTVWIHCGRDVDTHHPPFLLTKAPRNGLPTWPFHEPGYRKLRVENSLTDEHGDEVTLEKGGRVAVTVTAEEKRMVEKP